MKKSICSSLFLVTLFAVAACENDKIPTPAKHADSGSPDVKAIVSTPDAAPALPAPDASVAVTDTAVAVADALPAPTTNVDATIIYVYVGPEAGQTTVADVQPAVVADAKVNVADAPVAPCDVLLVGPEAGPEATPTPLPDAAPVLPDTAPECVSGTIETCPAVQANGETWYGKHQCVNGVWWSCLNPQPPAPDAGTPDATPVALNDAQVVADALVKTDTTPVVLADAQVKTDTLPADVLVTVDTTPAAPDTFVSIDTLPAADADPSACAVEGADTSCVLSGCSTYAVSHCSKVSGSLKWGGCTCVQASFPGPAIMDCQKDNLGRYTFTLWGVANGTGIEGDPGLEGGFFHHELGVPTKVCLAGTHNNWSRSANCPTGVVWAPYQTFQFVETVNMAGKVFNLVGLIGSLERWGDEDPYLSVADATAQNKDPNLGTIMPAGICSLTTGGFLVNQ